MKVDNYRKIVGFVLHTYSHSYCSFINILKVVDLLFFNIALPLVKCNALGSFNRINKVHALLLYATSSCDLENIYLVIKRKFILPNYRKCKKSCANQLLNRGVSSKIILKISQRAHDVK